MHKIAVIPGDGTGPEVVAEGLKVLEAVARKYSFNYETQVFDFSGERYLKTGKTVTGDDIAKLKEYHAIYLGAVGHPEVKPGILETEVLLKLRFSLDQYINLRPVKLYDARFCPVKDKGPKEVDFVVVRENSEGLYKGMGEFKDKGTAAEIATQVSYNTRKGVERCIRYAFEYTRKRNNKKKLTLCGKTNVLTYAWD
ncbi:MAG: isocitrate/isopropylmalate family dehydrogenase, partial [Candidatus Omnitrophota bacterium]